MMEGEEYDEVTPQMHAAFLEMHVTFLKKCYKRAFEEGHIDKKVHDRLILKLAGVTRVAGVTREQVDAGAHGRDTATQQQMTAAIEARISHLNLKTDFGVNTLREWKPAERRYHVEITAAYTARSLQKAVDGTRLTPQPPGDYYNPRPPARTTMTSEERREWQERMHNAKHVHGAHYLDHLQAKERLKPPVPTRPGSPIFDMNGRERRQWQERMHNANHVHGAHYMATLNEQEGSQTWRNHSKLKLTSQGTSALYHRLHTAKHVHGGNHLENLKRGTVTPVPQRCASANATRFR